MSTKTELVGIIQSIDKQVNHINHLAHVSLQLLEDPNVKDINEYRSMLADHMADIKGYCNHLIY